MSLEESADITLELIREFINEQGYSPTYGEIAEARGCSRATIALHLKYLVEEGSITRDGNKQRTWRVV